MKSNPNANIMHTEKVHQRFCMVTDKELTLHILHLNRIPAIELVDETHCTYPVVGRIHGHHQGTDIMIVENQDQAREEGYDFFTKLYVIEQEYRIEIQALDVQKVEEAVPKQVTFNEIPIRTEAYGWQWKEVSKDTIPEEWIQIAIRALYVTGLPNGFVKIGKLVNGSPLILDINPPSQFIEVMVNIPQLPFTIGTDVEFMLNYEGELIPASQFFPIEGPIGCDGRQIEQDSGEYALAEIRPEKAQSPQELYTNIRRLLSEASKKVPYQNIAFRAGSMPFSGYQCGGHIHFGTPLSLPLLRALDQYIAIPMALIEDSRSAKRRRKTKHGGLGKYRIRPYGFEYISLSSWLIDPEITLGVLSLAYLVVTHHHELTGDFLSDPQVQRAYYHGNKIYLKHFWPEIKKQILKTSSYPLYQKELSPLFEKIENAQCLDDASNLRENWGLEKEQQLYLPGMTIHIPKKIRKQLNLKEGQQTTIRAGSSLESAAIHPYPFSFRDPTMIQLSQPLRDSLSLPKLWNPRVFSKNGVLSLGPIMGIVASRPLGLQVTYFQHLFRLGKEKRILVYLFEPKDIDWEKKVIHGTSIYGNGTFPFPDVIYDRYFLGNPGSLKQEIDDVRLKFQQIYKISFINPPSLFDLTGNKWESHVLLSAKHKEFLPDTRLLEEPENVHEMLNRYGDLFLKPINGAAGEGIIRIMRKPTGIICVNSNEQEIQQQMDKNELVPFISSLLKQNAYIIQEGIPRKKLKGNHVEIRVYIQKNGQGQWMRTGMVARLTKNGIISTGNEVNVRASNVFLALFPDPTERYKIRRKLGQITRSIVNSVEDHIGTFGELAVDLCIDTYNSIKIIEINAKPDNLFSAIKAFKIRTLAGNRLLSYASLIAGYGNEGF